MPEEEEYQPSPLEIAYGQNSLSGSTIDSLEGSSRDLLSGSGPLSQALGQSMNQRQQILQRGLERLRASSANRYDEAGALAAMAGGFLSPTRGGSFGESLGNAGHAVSPFLSRIGATQNQREMQADQLEQLMAGLGQENVTQRLTLGSRLAQTASTARRNEQLAAAARLRAGNAGGAGGPARIQGAPRLIEDPESSTGWSWLYTDRNGNTVRTERGAPAPGGEGNLRPTTLEDGDRQYIVASPTQWSSAVNRFQEHWRRLQSQGARFENPADLSAYQNDWIARNMGMLAPGTRAIPDWMRGTAPVPMDPNQPTRGGAPADPNAPAQAPGTGPGIEQIPRQDIAPPGREAGQRPPAGALRPAVPQPEMRPRLAPTEAKQLEEVNNGLAAGTNAITSFDQALTANRLAYDGMTAHAAWVANRNLGRDRERVNATAAYQNAVQQLTSAMLKATFGGAPTEGERNYMERLNGSLSMSREERRLILEEGKKLVQARMNWQRFAANEIRAGRQMPSFAEFETRQGAGGGRP